MDWMDVRRVVRTFAAQWLYDPNVTLIDYGHPTTGGTMQFDKLCLRVHMAQKLPAGPMLEAAIERGLTQGVVPRSIDGVPVDVVPGRYRLNWSGTVPWRSTPSAAYASPRKSRQRPLVGGISISDGYRPVAGTLGGPVCDRDNGALMVLSNWHVLVGERGRPGQPIRQPGRGDGGGAADTVGSLARDAMAQNLDAAVALLQGTPVSNQQYGLRAISGVATAQFGMGVAKSGRTSGVTRGQVTGVEGLQTMRYPGIGTRQIRNVVTVTPHGSGAELSTSGDSGSIWLDESTGEAIGLHFAGNTPGQPEVALCLDLFAVLNALNVDLVL